MDIGDVLRNRFRPRARTRRIDPPDELVQTAAEGRRLAIYDDASGMYAYWYLEQRAQEEVSRARRYKKSFAVVRFWSREGRTIMDIADYLYRDLRENDLAGYLRGGQFVILLPETTIDGANVVLNRALSHFPGTVEGGVAIYPEDGASFDELLDAATPCRSSAPGLDHRFRSRA